MPVMIRVTSKGGYMMYINANYIVAMDELEDGSAELMMKGQSMAMIVQESMDDIISHINTKIKYIRGE